jgi:hypothetical protein
MPDASHETAVVKSQAREGRSGLREPGMILLAMRSIEAAISDDRTNM